MLQQRAESAQSSAAASGDEMAQELQELRKSLKELVDLQQKTLLQAKKERLRLEYSAATSASETSAAAATPTFTLQPMPYKQVCKFFRYIINIIIYFAINKFFNGTISIQINPFK